MSRRGGALAIAAACVIVAVGAAACSSTSSASSRPADGAPTSGSAPAAWSTFGNGLENGRYAAEERTLNAANVAKLTVKWQRNLHTGVASTPAVVDGVVYFGTFDSRVMAVDASTGATKWEAKVDESVMSSVTVTDDAVFALSNRHAYRIDRANGHVVWRSVTSAHPIAITPSSPVLVDGRLVFGIASGELMVPTENYKFRGSILAVDAATGTIVWRQWLTAGDATAGNGVGVWSTGSVDRKFGLIYFGTGNTYEPPTAKLSDGMVALDYRTGRIGWAHQFTNADVWSTGHTGGLDADVGAGPNLFTVKGTPAVGAGDKQGTYRALDRRTGRILWQRKMTDGSLLGGVIGTSATDGQHVFVASNKGDAASNAPTAGTKVLSLATSDGSIAWSVDFPGTIYAPVTISPQIVWVATTAAKHYALDSRTGATLWTADAVDQVGSGASVVDGTVYWGAGYQLFGSGEGKGTISAYSLGTGTTSGSTGGGAAVAAGASGASGDTPADLFRRSCASCHGLEGKGGVGPSLVGIAKKLTETQHRRLVIDGKPGTQMPAFGGVLSDAEIDAIVKYERTHL